MELPNPGMFYKKWRSRTHRLTSSSLNHIFSLRRMQKVVCDYRNAQMRRYRKVAGMFSFLFSSQYSSTEFWSFGISQYIFCKNKNFCLSFPPPTEIASSSSVLLAYDNLLCGERPLFSARHVLNNSQASVQDFLFKNVHLSKGQEFVDAARSNCERSLLGLCVDHRQAGIRY